MSMEWALLVVLLITSAPDLVHGQLPYSSNPPAYEIPPLGVIHEYQRQIEDDVYAVERKAELVGHRECVSGLEKFLFCPLSLNIFDFTACVINPATAQGADALSRGIKFPSSAFSATPSVAVGISGIGTGPTCGVKVEAKDVYASGFNIEITGSFLFYPFSLRVLWIACPVKQPLNSTVRDFTPKKGVPPPPYFPIKYGPAPSNKAEINASDSDINLIYNDNNPRYDETNQVYEESLPIEEDFDDEETSKTSSKTSESKDNDYSVDKTTNSYTSSSSTYRTSTTKYDDNETSSRARSYVDSTSA